MRFTPRVSFCLLLFLLTSVFSSAEILTSPPEKPDASKRYLIYLHGGIVEGSDGRPESPVHGPYLYRDILERFEKDGFAVISEIRPRGYPVDDYAKRVAGWIADLKNAGVPGKNIGVVGASQGGIMTVVVSTLVDDPEVRYVIVAGMFRDLTNGPNLRLHGRVFAIHDKADTHHFAPEKYFKQSPALAASKALVTDSGRGHGLVYRPVDEWYLPALEWLR